jgi:hypothetical protein
MLWASKLSFVVDILAFWGLGDCLGYFLIKIGQFFKKSSGHPVSDPLESLYFSTNCHRRRRQLGDRPFASTIHVTPKKGLTGQAFQTDQQVKPRKPNFSRIKFECVVVGGGAVVRPPSTF